MNYELNPVVRNDVKLTSMTIRQHGGPNLTIVRNDDKLVANAPSDRHLRSASTNRALRKRKLRQTRKTKLCLGPTTMVRDDGKLKYKLNWHGIDSEAEAHEPIASCLSPPLWERNGRSRTLSNRRRSGRRVRAPSSGGAYVKQSFFGESVF